METIIITFSGRVNKGNSYDIANFLKDELDGLVIVKEMGKLNISHCGQCDYECFKNQKCVHCDDMTKLYQDIVKSDCIIYIIPLYCGFSSSLYVKYKERLQGFLKDESYKSFEGKVAKYVIIGNRKSGANSLENWLIDEEGISKTEILVLESTEFKISSIRSAMIEIEEVKERLKKLVGI